MAEAKTADLMEKLVSLCKRRGFIYQSSEIYGGINGFWDYGPLGAELKHNIKEQWWNWMTRLREDVVGLDATIIMSPKIWEASGHVSTFSDPMIDCKTCKGRFRADQISEIPCPQKPSKMVSECHGEKTEARAFNLMFKTVVGPIESDENIAYLRPETAQAIFVQFKNVLETSRQKLPFGIAQVGKAFRNEVTPRNYTFRSREFEQMELEFFIKPDEAIEAIAGSVAKASDILSLPASTQFAEVVKTLVQIHKRHGYLTYDAIVRVLPDRLTVDDLDKIYDELRKLNLEILDHDDGQQLSAVSGSHLEPQRNWGWEAWHKYWVEERIRFYESIGLPRATLVEYWQKPEELAHYAKACVDILYKFPFSKRDEKGELMGEELEGIAARSDFDLSQHQRFSGKPMTVFDEELKPAWLKLDPAKQAELNDRYYQNRWKYLTKMGEAPEQAEKLARADAEALTKGYYVPHVIEPSAGVDRLALALICNAYAEDQAPDDKGKMESRVVMRFHPRIAPIKVAVLPLLKNKPELVKKATEVRDLLRPWMNVFYDDAGAIGRRYRRQDEAGTPFGVTIDFETLGEKGEELKDTVTLRERDSMKQERVKISELLPRLLEKVR